ncbi:MAG: UDP-3-O-acyl-N-acetylglucosamine deacetylase [Brevundimonas sp.]|uniref:UDP-3-O-acyl-N-acetylglucosamine deacetylase n=1 Tax=Brevundimonas sp. TaxID=1871086 RepID=UPI00403476AC
MNRILSLSPRHDHHEQTIVAPAICAGVGVHTGQRVRLAIRPAPAGTGIVFVRTDISDRDNRIKVSGEAVVDARLNTMIENTAGVRLSTIEHLMAAFCALGVSNAIVEVDGPELPILDGSALPFVQLLDRAGFRRQSNPVQYIEILEPIRVTDGDKHAALLPCDRYEMRFEIDFDAAVIGNQVVDFVVDEPTFRNEIMAARTFGFAHEVQALRQAGLARGGSLENAVVIDEGQILNPGGLRMEREFVRHKALDAIGDLYVLGAPLLGRYEGYKAGHAVNNLLVRALLANPQAWRTVTRVPELAEVA